MQSGAPRKRIRQIGLAGQSALSFHRSDETEKRRKHEGITIHDCHNRTFLPKLSSCYCALRLPIVPCHGGTTEKVGEDGKKFCAWRRNSSPTFEMLPAPLLSFLPPVNESVIRLGSKTNQLILYSLWTWNKTSSSISYRRETARRIASAILCK